MGTQGTQRTRGTQGAQRTQGGTILWKGPVVDVAPALVATTLCIQSAQLVEPLAIDSAFVEITGHQLSNLGWLLQLLVYSLLRITVAAVTKSSQTKLPVAQAKAQIARRASFGLHFICA